MSQASKVVTVMTGPEIRAWRVSRKLSQRALANLLGKKQGTVSRYETTAMGDDPMVTLALIGLGYTLDQQGRGAPRTPGTSNDPQRLGDRHQ